MNVFCLCITIFSNPFGTIHFLYIFMNSASIAASLVFFFFVSRKMIMKWWNRVFKLIGRRELHIKFVLGVFTMWGQNLEPSCIAGGTPNVDYRPGCIREKWEGNVSHHASRFWVTLGVPATPSQCQTPASSALHHTFLTYQWLSVEPPCFQCQIRTIVVSHF